MKISWSFKKNQLKMSTILLTIKYNFEECCRACFLKTIENNLSILKHKQRNEKNVIQKNTIDTILETDVAKKLMKDMHVLTNKDIFWSMLRKITIKLFLKFCFNIHRYMVLLFLYIISGFELNYFKNKSIFCTYG